MSRPALATAAVAIGLAGCSQRPADPGLDQRAMVADVRTLASDIGPRAYDSAGSSRAADWIAGRLQAMHLRVERIPVGHLAHPELRVLGLRVFRPLEVHIRDADLLVRIPPADTAAAGEPAILLMAHYDTVPGAPGAVDDAASVALLLELARHYADAPPPHPLYLAFTAAEEMRLSGAIRLAEEIGDRVGVAIALDLVGASDTVTLNGLSKRIGLAWMRRIAAAARDAGVAVHAPAVFRLISRRLPATERSDHGPFTTRGIPAFHLYSRGRDRIYLPYHSPLDRPERVDWDGVLATGAVVTELIDDPDPLPAPGGEPGWWVELPGGPRVVPVAVLMLLEALLAATAIGGLIALARRRQRGRRLVADLIGFAVIYALAWLAAGGALALLRARTGHPAPWLHAPGRSYLAATAIAAGVAFALSRLLARAAAPSPPGRFLAAAIVTLLVAAVPALLVGAPELALRPLAAAALFGAAAWPRRPAVAVPLAALGLAPLAAALDPALAREGFFHDFLRADFPVTVALAAVMLPVFLVATWAWRSAGPALPARGKAAIALVAAPLIIAAQVAGLQASARPPCSGDDFLRAGLYCEIAPPAAGPGFTDRPGPQ